VAAIVGEAIRHRNRDYQWLNRAALGAIERFDCRQRSMLDARAANAACKYAD